MLDHPHQKLQYQFLEDFHTYAHPNKRPHHSLLSKYITKK